MKQSECLGVNQQGHLTIGGCDTVLLAKQYGTPLYVMDEEGIRAACRSYRSSIDRFYSGRGMVCYASKAFCCKEICRIMDAEQMGLDVVSEGELYTALAAGFPAERICFHGNNKTDHELKYALQSGIGLFIVDNRYELERLNRFAGELGVKAQIAFRIKPGVDAHTHDFVRTGQIDSKFGVALETGEAMEIVLEALQMEHLCLKGVHCHIGSQIFELEPFELLEKGRTDVIFAAKQTGYSCDWTPLCQDAMYAILPPEYPLGEMETFPIELFEGKEFLMPYGRFDLDVKAALDKNGVKPRIRPCHVDDETVIRMVGKGLGLSMMAEMMLRGRTAGVQVVPISPATGRELGMGMHMKESVPDGILHLRECVLAFIGTL